MPNERCISTIAQWKEICNICFSQLDFVMVMTGHKIESVIGPSIDLASVLLSQVTAGHVTESEIGLAFLNLPTSLSIS